MTAYDTEQWHDLLVASAGAAAALAGLVFVAVSINIERILEHAGQAERALHTVLLLLAAVVTSLLATMFPGHLLTLVAGVSLVAGAGGGLRWLAAALIAAVVGAVVNAWVLLVGILR